MVPVRQEICAKIIGLPEPRVHRELHGQFGRLGYLGVLLVEVR